MAAEAQGVGQGVPHVRAAALVGHHVQVAGGVRHLIVDGGGDDSPPPGALAQNRASTAPAAPSMWPVMDLVELMASLIGVAAEHRLDGGGLAGVVQGGWRCRGR